jgi:hypothetical protein
MEESGVLSSYPTENLGREQMLHLVSQALGEVLEGRRWTKDIADELMRAIEQHVDYSIGANNKIQEEKQDSLKTDKVTFSNCTVLPRLPPLQCINGNHRGGDATLDSAPDQQVIHNGCVFWGR